MDRRYHLAVAAARAADTDQLEDIPSPFCNFIAQALNSV